MGQSNIVGLLLALWSFTAIILSCYAGVPKEPDQSPTVVQSLYNASDNVVILNATNFKSTVYGDTKGWLVEFYNSWCGFCFRFAPTWKTFASDVYLWRDVVVIAAIDCADDDNNPICRKYEVMHYPMIKYFSVNAHESSLGTVLEKHDNVDDLRHSLINQLEKEQQEGRGSSWPNITPYRNYETTNIWKAVPESIKYFFLLFEHIDSRLGVEVILDLHSITAIQIRRVTSDNELLCETNKITKFPSILVFNRNETQKLLTLKIPTREGISNAIKEYMILKGESLAEFSLVIHNKESTVRASSTSTSIQLQIAEETQSLASSGDYLYQLDLENTLRYSISHEIPLTKMIEGEKLDALKKYVNVLATYFPLRQNAMFLEILRDIIQKKDRITGEEFSQLIKSIEEEMSPVYSGPPQWIGCKGSAKGYRGYPCGLWTMFHMLTVNFAIKNKNNSEHDPTEVLRAMHGYIKNFFGCADCAQHFIDMASKKKMLDVFNDDENILWLWRAHNEVNARLSGDQTEDPKHKKIQYPLANHCETCRYMNSTWNEDEVLHYLKSKYSYDAINYTGSSVKPPEKSIVKLNVRQERLVLSKYTTAKKLGWDFTIFDISICVVLYVASATILILVCVKFAVKRSYRKKAYVSLLGKV